MRPSPTISSVLPPSSSSRLVRSPIMPRQWCFTWLSRAKWSWRDIARISDIACSATARAFTPCGARKADAGGLERLALILVGAGADRLDELELRRARDQVVAPHPGNADHVGIRDAHGELLGRVHLEMPDAGVARRKALGHAVGHMGKADGEVVLSAETPCVAPAPSSGRLATIPAPEPSRHGELSSVYVLASGVAMAGVRTRTVPGRNGHA